MKNSKERQRKKIRKKKTLKSKGTKLKDLQEDKSSLLERLKEHGESSNVHGISHILTRKSKFRKCVWIVSFLGLTAFAGYQLMQIYLLYKSYPTQTNVKIDFKPLPFPMVSICNMNPIRLSQVENVNSVLLKAILRGDDISLAVNNYKAEYSDFIGDDVDYDTNENKIRSDPYIAYQLFLNKMEQQPV
ncbi:unnamed protein product [Mytilus coruscus]|uniref:ASIC5 n=1 Tax=Mytilus coruscus TaxID=42192 RepID=A0A6J8E274_MYTCO|nr:unnamed protein product [Mytilus coruscus]